MSRGEGRKLKLMVVDDEPDNLDLLFRTFRRDFKVHKADSALKALEILDQEGEMAIIISDQRMPEMNGTEFLGKTVDRFPDTIRILLTGYTDVEDLVEAINSGQVFKYITKPWNPEELRTVVQQASETYKFFKQRTNALRRSLKRERLYNDVVIALRESLDYGSMLQTIADTVGETFEAVACRVRLIEEGALSTQEFCYQGDEGETEVQQPWPENSEALMQKVLEHCTTQKEGNDGDDTITQVVVPLTYQHDLLAVLAVYRNNPDLPWSEEDIQLLEVVSEQASLALSQARLYQRTLELAEQMQNELNVARQIQMNLLRQSWPEFDNLKLQACCYPARQVGGDFFEVHIHSQGDIWVALGDVSGKGVPAALFMASAVSVLRRELSQETSPEPEQVMYNLNSILSDDLIGNNHFITVVVARYTPTTGQLSYANAGHIYPLIWDHRTLQAQNAKGDGNVTVEPVFLKERGIPLGILPVWRGKVGSLTLSPGDVFLLTSDGITEATVVQQGSDGNSARAMLQQEGLWQLLKQQTSLLDLEALLATIREQNPVQEDDQTILSLEVLSTDDH